MALRQSSLDEQQHTRLRQLAEIDRAVRLAMAGVRLDSGCGRHLAYGDQLLGRLRRRKGRAGLVEDASERHAASAACQAPLRLNNRRRPFKPQVRMVFQPAPIALSPPPTKDEAETKSKRSPQTRQPLSPSYSSYPQIKGAGPSEFERCSMKNLKRADAERFKVKLP